MSKDRILYKVLDFSQFQSVNMSHNIYILCASVQPMTSDMNKYIDLIVMVYGNKMHIALKTDDSNNLSCKRYGTGRLIHLNIC